MTNSLVWFFNSTHEPVFRALPADEQSSDETTLITLEKGYRDACATYFFDMQQAGRNSFASFAGAAIKSYKKRVFLYDGDLESRVNDIKSIINSRNLIKNEDKLIKIIYDAALYRAGACDIGSIANMLEVNCIEKRTLLGDDRLQMLLGICIEEKLDELINNNPENIRCFDIKGERPKCNLRESCIAADALTYDLAEEIFKTIFYVSTLKGTDTVGSLASFTNFSKNLSNYGITEDMYLGDRATRSDLKKEISEFIRDQVFYFADIVTGENNSDMAMSVIRIAVDAALYRCATMKNERFEGFDLLRRSFDSVCLPLEEVPFFFKNYIYYNVISFIDIDYNELCKYIK